MEEKISNGFAGAIFWTVTKMKMHGFWWIEGFIASVIVAAWSFVFTFYMQLFLMLVMLVCVIICLFYLPCLVIKKKVAKTLLLFITILVGGGLVCAPLVGMVSNKENDRWLVEKRAEVWIYSRYYMEYMMQKNIWMREMKEVPEDVDYKEWVLKTTNPIAVYVIAFDKKGDVLKKNHTVSNGQAYEVFDFGNHYYMIVQWLGS